MRDLRAAYINPRNEQMYHHGGTWKAPQESDGVDTTIVTHEHVVELPFSKVIEHDLRIVPQYIDNIVGGMFGHFQTHLFKTVEESTTRSGNVVDAATSPDLAEAYLEALQKIEFGVDENGAVSRPTLYPGKEIAQKLAAAIQEKGPDFAAKVADLIKTKDSEALEKEKARKAKFVSDSD